MAEYLEYVLWGLAGLICFAAVAYVSFRYEQGRRREEARMTPAERREQQVFKNVFRRR